MRGVRPASPLVGGEPEAMRVKHARKVGCQWPASGGELFLDSPTSTTGREPLPYSPHRSDKRSAFINIDKVGAAGVYFPR